MHKHPINEIPLSNHKERIIDPCHNMKESKKYYAVRKKLDSNRLYLCDTVE